MRRNISQFKVWEESTKQTKYWANYADENVLLATHPGVKHWVDLTEQPIDYILSASPSLSGKRTVLSDILKASGNVREVDREDIYWKLKATGEVQAVATENLNPGVVCPGLQGAEFPIKLDMEIFVPGDVLCTDIAKTHQVVVQGSEDTADGNGFIYMVQYVGSLEEHFPPQLLEAGLNWIKIDSVYGEASHGYGSTSFQGLSWVEFKTSMTDYAKSVEVTNKAHNVNLRVTMHDAEWNQLHEYPDQVISYIEAEFLAQIRWEKELRAWFGRGAGKHIIDNTVGNHRRIGPGILEFLERGNRFEYPLHGLSIDLFTQFLSNLAFDRVPVNQRNYVLLTGQGGLIEWNKLITREFSQSTVKADFNSFVSPGTSYDPANYKGFKYSTGYFTEFTMFPFGSIKVVHVPSFDNTYINGGLLHPDTGLPLSSYEYYLLDVGFGNGGRGNIEFLKLKDAEAYAYICGIWSPRGPINMKGGSSMFTATHGGRSYELKYASTEGFRVKDIMRTAMFSPAIQA
jgi:hypothetical protein